MVCFRAGRRPGAARGFRAPERATPPGHALEVQDTDHWIAGAVQFFSFHGGPQPIAFRELRINEQIRIPNVRLFDDTTQEAFGVVAIERARQLALERELDLVEVAPMAQPPVCRLMDYGKFKFEALKKEKDSRREHNVVRLKEMKLRPKISEHDFRTKFGYVQHFLKDGDKVKLTIMFRGREMVHQEYGRKLLDRMAAELKEVAIIERNPLVEGRNMIMILSPLAKKQAKGPHQEGEAPVAGTVAEEANGRAAGGDHTPPHEQIPSAEAPTAEAAAPAAAPEPVSAAPAAATDTETTTTEPEPAPAAQPEATATVEAAPAAEPTPRPRASRTAKTTPATPSTDTAEPPAATPKPPSATARKTRGSTGTDAKDQDA